VTWLQVGAVTVGLGATAYVGLAVTSHNTTAAATATFDHVSIAGNSGALPAPWTDQDIGDTGQAGNATYSAGVFTVNGSGANIWYTADSFNYLARPVSGDIEIVDRVAALANTNLHAKAGLMFR